MYILGISAFYHDSAAVLLKDGEIIAAAQEERFSRKKHDHRFPSGAIKFCLDYAGISSRDLEFVAFYDKPFLKFERLIETYISYAPAGIKSFLKSMPLWMSEKIWLKDLIRKELNYDGKILFPEHHLSHAASAFYPSPFEKAAILTIDGVGEWTTTSIGRGNGNSIELLSEIKFPHSLGMLYSAFTYYTGFRVNSGEYKVMGLAPYGEPKYADLILSELMDLKEDGSFKLNMKYFNYCAGLTMTNEKFHKLFGGNPRRPESELTQREMDLARSVQDVTEIVMLKIAKHIAKSTGEKNLVMAGGVALNCVANGKILNSGIFENLWIQPAAGDAGGALGAALSVWHGYLGINRTADNKTDSMKGAYLGTEYDKIFIEDFLRTNDISYIVIPDAEVAKKGAELIASENVVGWFQGRMEFGPRALGARSIIGDARSPKMQSVMNLKIKYRESFRPFAPSVLGTKVNDFFDFSGDSPYMLLVADVQKAKRREMTGEEKKLFGIEKLNIIRSEIPAVTHIDYSARLQTVHKETNPLYFELIEEFDRMTGVPVIINTSFNVRGEPIVCSPQDAFICFMRTEMDYLMLGNYLLDKKKQKPIDKNTSWMKEYELD